MRLRGLFAFAVVVASVRAYALDAGLPDASVDGGSFDAGAGDAAAEASTDASTEASTDASTDAATDASTPKDSGTTTDASGACCPSLPCTCPSDEASIDDAGTEDAGSPGGCSCQSSPLDAGSTWPLALVVAALLSRSRRKRS